MFYKIIYVHNYIFVTFCVIACKFILLSEMACAGFENMNYGIMRLNIFQEENLRIQPHM